MCDPTSHTCVIGSSCGVTQIKADVVAPNLLIVLDRSCTMKGPLDGSTKWDIAVDALAGLVTEYNSKLLFGLTLFPDSEKPNCTQAKYLMPPKAGNETAIEQLLTAAHGANNPDRPGNPCVTNGAQTMKQASAEPSLDDKTRQSFFVLVTDGLTQQGCDLTGAPEGTVQILKDLHDQRGISTYVIGFGSGQIDKDELNKFAEAGGVPASDATDPSFRYYRAENAATLQQALKTVAQQSLGCEYQLASTPPDAKNIHVFFDKKSEVAQDTSHQDGWDYDASANHVTFQGPTCANLKAGKVGAIDIVLGCPGGGNHAGSGGSGGENPCGPGGQPCDLTNLCIGDPDIGPGLCTDGCCTYK
jgi:hypothetical protein